MPIVMRIGIVIGIVPVGLVVPIVGIIVCVGSNMRDGWLRSCATAVVATAAFAALVLVAASATVLARTMLVGVLTLEPVVMI